MSNIGIKVPSPGESISEVVIAKWFINNGDYVQKNQEIAELESDKATLTLTADDAGEIQILKQEGETVEVGSIACTINTSVSAPKKLKTEISKPEFKPKQQKGANDEIKKVEIQEEDIKITPIAKKILQEKGVTTEIFLNKLHRITSKDIDAVLNYKSDSQSLNNESRNEERKKLSPLRKKMSERLVQVKNQTAMLTTFNEVNMQVVIDIRNQYKDKFFEK